MAHEHRWCNKYNGKFWFKCKNVKEIEKKLNRAKEHYEDNKERLGEQARNKYTELSNEEKNKKIEYGRSRHHNMSEENKQRLKEYQKVTVKHKNQSKKNFCFFSYIV